MKQLIYAFWPFLKPYRNHFYLGGFFILLSTGITVLIPWVMGEAVDKAYMKNKEGLVWALAAFGLLILLEFAVDALKSYIIESTGHKVTHKLRSGLFEHVLSLKVSYFDKNPVGRPLTRIINDIKSIGELFTASLALVVVDFLTILGTMVAMFLVNPRLAFYVLIPFPLIFAIVYYFGEKLAAVYRNSRQALSEINAFLGEHVAAIAAIQRLGVEHNRLEKFVGLVEKHNRFQKQSVRVFAKVSPFANIINGISWMVLLSVGGKMAIEGSITVGVLVAYIGFLKNLFQPVRDLVEKYNLILSARVSLERVVSLFEIQGESKAPLSSGPHSFVFLDQSPSIEFENVCFTYPSREEPSLTNINFHIPGGSNTAIVGPTGGGKSSLIRLLLQFYTPSSGEITVGGLPLSLWNTDKLRQTLGVIHQELYLTQGTLRENLILEREDVSPQELLRVYEELGLKESFEERGGLDCPIEEGGRNLSVGERQLVSFARILLMDKPIVILDEATASLDPQMESQVMAALEKTLKNRTSIVIAHRLSTLKKADHVIVIEQGQVTQMGTPHELFRQEGLFQTFQRFFLDSQSDQLGGMAES